MVTSTEKSVRRGARAAESESLLIVNYIICNTTNPVKQREIAVTYTVIKDSPTPNGDKMVTRIIKQDLRASTLSVTND